METAIWIGLANSCQMYLPVWEGVVQSGHSYLGSAGSTKQLSPVPSRGLVRGWPVPKKGHSYRTGPTEQLSCTFLSREGLASLIPKDGDSSLGMLQKQLLAVQCTVYTFYLGSIQPRTTNLKQLLGQVQSA
jgi:hypothetical protein